jgi:pimeloyl-[acyl-carrier protein] methyl ester esterase
MTQLLLLLPGLDGTGRLFARFQRRFAPSAAVEVMAYPPDPRQSLEDLALLVETQIGKRTATLIAESFSGPVALRVASRKQAALEKVALIASFAAPPRSLSLTLARLIPLFSLAAIPPPRSVIAATMLNGCRDPALLDEVMAVVRTIPPPLMSARLRLMAGLRNEDLRCDLPVLSIQALRDRIVPARSLDDLRRACSRIEERGIDGPHLLLQSQPQSCLDLLGPFIA